MQEKIEPLQYTEFADIYASRIMQDFPAAERRPLRSIQRLYAKGSYQGYALRRGGETLAYASFMGAPGVGSLLLDYFAVEKNQRGTGIGGRFLQQLRGVRQATGILIECESPGTARTEAQRETRQRRIAFYQRGGAQLASFVWHAFSVDYRILWLPVEAPLEESRAEADIQAIYAAGLPKGVIRAMTRIKK